MQPRSLETGGRKGVALFDCFYSFCSKKKPTPRSLPALNRFPALGGHGVQCKWDLHSMSRGTCCSFSLPHFRPRLVGQATQGAVLKKFSVPQPTPALRALLLAPGSPRPKKSFSVRLQAILSLQASLQRLAQPIIFRPPSPPNLLNKVLSALENCLPGLVLEKHFLYLFFGHFIIRYFVDHRKDTQVTDL